MRTRFFYILTEGRVRGPFPEQGIVQLAAQGRLPADARLSEDQRTWFPPEAILPPDSMRVAEPPAAEAGPAASGPPPIAKRSRTRLPDVKLPKISGQTAIVFSAAAICGIVLLVAVFAPVRHIATAPEAGDHGVPQGAPPADTAAEWPGGYGSREPAASSPPQSAGPPLETVAKPAGPSANPSPAGTVGDSPPPSPGSAHWLERVQKATVTVLTDTGQGSGFFIDSPWTYPVVVTNSHVVEDAGAIQVRLHDGTLAGVTRGTAYPQYDLAFLAVDGLQRPPAGLPLRKDLPALTEKVFAYGAPLGLTGSVTEGIVSAVRTTEELDRALEDAVGTMTPYENVRWIQTTAAISPGNSGGPLVDAQGQVVGVNTLAFSSEMRAQNLNFAVSADQVVALLPHVRMARFPPPSRYTNTAGGVDNRNPEPGVATLAYWLKMKAALRVWLVFAVPMAQIYRYPPDQQSEILVDFSGSCVGMVAFLNTLDDADVDREAIQCKDAICNLMAVLVKSLASLVEDPGNPILLAQIETELNRTGAAMVRAEQTAR
ncbi:MAG: trypsin-like serine protease, partial [Thermogutta sp.]|nr:trypsin-like serine protease [Thermogutta sp.]